jgi:hypothetical protein
MHRSVKFSMLLLALAGPLPGFAAGEPLAFTPEEIAEWSEREFNGRTTYEPVSADQAGSDHTALRAECRNATASGRLLEREISLEDTPILEWRWRVDALYDGLDERRKSGDDYPARVYVVARRWPAFRSRAINYVWSSGQAVGTTWPNAYSSAFVMVAVRSGPEQLGEWVVEKRNIREDFRRLHDLDLDTVDAIAVMTDCDDAGQTTTAFYGPMHWRSDGSTPD